ncbi:MAG TPA: amidohydrolase [Saprospiraceae bacterium]|nr:amidohydrolase [Saprospiraceae bacterium]
MQRILSLALFSLLVMACQQAGKTPEQPLPTLILVNGNFFTADSAQTKVTAVAIAGERILALGTDEAMKKLAGPQTQVLDLQGAFAMPGFIEGHGHFNGLGQSLQNLNLIQTKSWEEITGMVAEKVKNTKPGEWIEGRGWHQEKWIEPAGTTVNGYPYHHNLSAVSPNNPVILYHASGHGLIANAKALELAGISRETSDPVGGRIVRDAKGNLTGVFEENAMTLIEKPFSQWLNQRSEAEKVAAFDKTTQLAAQECLAKGITSFQDAGSGFWELEQYRRLAEAGQLPLRLWAMASQPQAHDIPKLANYPQIGLGKGFFTCRAVKCYFDGALGSYGAWLLAPYDDKPGFVGQNTTPLDTIANMAQVCKKYGLQLCVHAIGDRANREVLNVAENARLDKDARWRIEHAQHVDPQDIPRFAQLGVIASMQAIHCTSDAPFVVKRLGEQRARTGAYAWRSLIDSGAHLTNGTDAPVEDVDPLPCLYASVTRKRADTGFEFFPEQKMTREEALRSYTIWNAWGAFEEKEKGSLTPGKLADIVVLSKDLLQCQPEEILQAKVLKTIVGGKVAFEGR